MRYPFRNKSLHFSESSAIKFIIRASIPLFLLAFIISVSSAFLHYRWDFGLVMIAFSCIHHTVFGGEEFALARFGSVRLDSAWVGSRIPLLYIRYWYNDIGWVDGSCFGCLGLFVYTWMDRWMGGWVDVSMECFGLVMGWVAKLTLLLSSIANLSSIYLSYFLAWSFWSFIVGDIFNRIVYRLAYCTI